MASLKIETDLGVLDLLDGTDSQFYITRQVKDLSSLQEAKADFTKTISIPATPNNNKILGESTIGIKSVSTKIACSIELDGLPVAPVATLLHVNTTIVNGVELFEVAILYGNFGLFDSILGGTIDELNWADLAIDWEPVDLATIASNDTDMVFAISDYAGDDFGFFGGLGIIDVNRAGFWMYAKEIINRTVQEAGYKVQIISAPDDYYEFAINAIIPKFADPIIYEEGASIISEVNNTANIITKGTTRKADFDNVVTDIAGVWRTTPDFWYLFPDVAQIDIIIIGEYNHVQGHPNNLASEIRIMQNTSIVATLPILGTNNNIAFSLSFTTTVVPNDVIWIECFSETRSGGAADSILTLLPGTAFSVSTPDNENRNINPSDWLPKINKKEFLSSVLSQFNMMVTTDDITKTAFLYAFDEIASQPQQDWSLLINEKREIDIQHAIAGYAQNSRFRYLDDESLVRNDFNYNKAFNNEILELETTVIQMPWAACDRSVLTPATEIDICVIPQILTETEFVENAPSNIINFSGKNFTILDANYELDFQVGDYIGPFVNSGSGAQSSARRIVQKTTNLTGVVSKDFLAPLGDYTGFSITRYESQDTEIKCGLIKDSVSAGAYALTQGGWDGTAPTSPDYVQLPANTKVATFADSLKWSEIVNNGHYKSLINALETPQKVSAWFNLPTSVFLATDFYKPVYIAQFASFYYINRINQFKAGNETKIDLIRISGV